MFAKTSEVPQEPPQWVSVTLPHTWNAVDGQDGEEIATKMGGKVYTFQTSISGEHTVTAKSGDLSDTMTIRKVEKANPDYRMVGGGQLVRC